VVLYTVAVAEITDESRMLAQRSPAPSTWRATRRGGLLLASLVAGACRPAPVPSSPGLPAATNVNGAGTAATCGDAPPCPEPEQCIEFYGIAGPKGPKSYACEIHCGDGAKCPDDLQCTTIADGPGAVCRPPAALTNPPPTPESPTPPPPN
jgi:hypothetical protein